MRQAVATGAALPTTAAAAGRGAGPHARLPSSRPTSMAAEAMQVCVGTVCCAAHQGSSVCHFQSACLLLRQVAGRYPRSSLLGYQQASYAAVIRAAPD